MVQFKVGDKVVYPVHGVAEIVSIETRDIGGSPLAFYMLNILENGMRMMVPTSNVEQVGMRDIVSSDEADRVFDVLKKREKMVESTTWNRRHREYMEKIKTGSLFEVAKVLRDLYVLKNDKELSFGERKMLDTARSLLVREISLSKGITHEEVETKFKAIFRC
jgi:CarD family transcriptional regulator